MKCPSKKSSLYCLLVAGILFLTPLNSHADIPLPSAFGFVAPLWMAVLTFGLLLVGVIIIEAVILMLLLGIDVKKAFVVVGVANLVSTLVGALWGNVLLVFVGSLIICPVSIYQFRNHWGLSTPHSWLLGLFPLVLLIGWTHFTFHRARAIESWAIFGSLVPAYFLSVFIEMLVAKRLLKDRKVIKPVGWANLASYAALAILLLVFQVRPIETPMLTIDYYGVSAREMARVGDFERAIELVREARKIGETGIGFWFVRRSEVKNKYYPFAERFVAHPLVESGHPELALHLLKEALDLPNVMEEDKKRIRNMIQEIEKQSMSQ